TGGSPAHRTAASKHGKDRRNGCRQWNLVLTSAVSGFFVGAIYGLFALGLIVIYRSSRAVNFAHGETGMVGAFVFAELWVTHGFALGVALLIALALTGALGAATEILIVRPLRNQPRINVLVATFGLAGFL